MKEKVDVLTFKVRTKEGGLFRRDEYEDRNVEIYKDESLKEIRCGPNRYYLVTQGMYDLMIQKMNNGHLFVEMHSESDGKVTINKEHITEVVTPVFAKSLADGSYQRIDSIDHFKRQTEMGILIAQAPLP